MKKLNFAVYWLMGLVMVVVVVVVVSGILTFLWPIMLLLVDNGKKLFQINIMSNNNNDTKWIMDKWE